MRTAPYRISGNRALVHDRAGSGPLGLVQIDPDQLGGRFSINACTPSSALGSIMLQAIVCAACS